MQTSGGCYYLDPIGVLDTSSNPHIAHAEAFCYCSAPPAWTHVALTHNGSGTTAALHVNGAAASATVTVSGLTSPGGGLQITGAAVDDLRVYTTDLSGDLERAGAPAAAAEWGTWVTPRRWRACSRV